MKNRHYFTNNDDLTEKRKEISFRFSNIELKFISDNGVFSKNSIDFGSRLLVENIIQENNADTILDVGCGYGFIGITIAKVLNKTIDMIDINDRAVSLAKQNVELNKVQGNVFISNLFENVEKKYEMVVCNPPIRAGKKVIYELFMQAHNYLQHNGKLWIVMRKQHGANSAINYLNSIYQKVELVDRENGFWIIKATKLSKID